MNPRLKFRVIFSISLKTLLFMSFLTMQSAAASQAGSPIKELNDLEPKELAFRTFNADNPLLIHSADESAMLFSDRGLAVLKREVNFKNQKVVLFAWRGSGQDRIEYVIPEAFPEQIRFTYKRGRTRDLRRHFRVFVVGVNGKCSVDGKPVRQRVDRDLEIQVKGQWMPGKMPLPLLEPGKPVKVKVRGTLNHGVMGIGGETTGTTIRFARTTWELDLRTEKAFGAAAERLNGKRVVVTGMIYPRQGVETGKRIILTVEAFKLADR